VVPVVPRKPAMPVGPVRPIPSFPFTELTISVLATMAPALRLLAVKVLRVNWFVHTLFPLLLTVMTYPPAIRPVPEYVVLFRRVSKSYSGVDMTFTIYHRDIPSLVEARNPYPSLMKLICYPNTR
jgi:hypothetical protein